MHPINGFINDHISGAVAAALEKGLDDAIALIENRYQQYPDSKDGFAGLGTVCFERGQYHRAFLLFERDRILGRLSPSFRHVFAYLLATTGRQKEAVVEISRAVAEDPTLDCGYLLVDRESGEALFPGLTLKKIFESRNCSVDHSTEILKRFHSHVRNGRLNDAGDMVAAMYGIDSSLKDGYALIGIVHRAFVQYEQALHYYETDRRLNRITPESRLILANLLAQFQKIKEAEDEVERAYAEDNGVRDGFALIGVVFRNMGRYEEARPYYEKDRNLNRLSPANRHIFADLLARSGRLDEADDEVEIGYAENSALRNGYARIGNIFRVNLNFSTALEYYGRDRKANRLTPVHRIIYAELSAWAGLFERAIDEISAAYDDDSSLADGYASCAWILYWPRKEYANLLHWMEKDNITTKQNSNTRKEDRASNFLHRRRMSPQWMLRLAQAYAANKEFEKALTLVEQVYHTEPLLSDGYSRCAWQYYWSRKEYEKIIHYCELDKSNGRLSPGWRLYLGQAYAAVGKVEKAMALVAEAYRLNTDLQNGYARCALQQFWTDNNCNTAIERIRLDEQLGRLSPIQRLNYAQVLAFSGNMEEAERQVEIAYGRDHNINDGYTRLMVASKSNLQLDTENPFFPGHIYSFLENDLKLNRLSKEGRRMALPVIKKHTMIASEIAQAEDRYGVDLSAQWNQLVSIARGGDKKVKVVAILNAELEISHASDILIQFREIVLHEQYRFETAAQIPFIIDGGADVGMAILYFKWLYPNCSILAFEPNPKMFDICQSNINHNGWENVKLLPYALSDKNADSMFCINKSMPMASRLETCVFDRAVEESGERIPVRSRRLSPFIKQDVHFLKLDIEGMECRVLKELGKSLCYVHGGFIEFHYDERLRHNSLPGLLESLEESKFIYKLVDQPNNAMENIFYSAPPSAGKRWSCGIFFNSNKTAQGETDG